jgi:hypothetical protein
MNNSDNSQLIYDYHIALKNAFDNLQNHKFLTKSEYTRKDIKNFERSLNDCLLFKDNPSNRMLFGYIATTLRALGFRKMYAKLSINLGNSYICLFLDTELLQTVLNISPELKITFIASRKQFKIGYSNSKKKYNVNNHTTQNRRIILKKSNNITNTDPNPKSCDLNKRQGDFTNNSSSSPLHQENNFNVNAKTPERFKPPIQTQHTEKNKSKFNNQQLEISTLAEDTICSEVREDKEDGLLAQNNSKIENCDNVPNFQINKVIPGKEKRYTVVWSTVKTKDKGSE